MRSPSYRVTRSVTAEVGHQALEPARGTAARTSRAIGACGSRASSVCSRNLPRNPVDPVTKYVKAEPPPVAALGAHLAGRVILTPYAPQTDSGIRQTWTTTPSVEPLAAPDQRA